MILHECLQISHKCLHISHEILCGVTHFHKFNCLGAVEPSCRIRARGGQRVGLDVESVNVPLKSIGNLESRKVIDILSNPLNPN